MTDETKAIDLDVSGPNAVEKTKAMLSGYDVDGDDVSRISICVYEAEDEPEPDDTKTSGTKTSKKISEDDRTLQGVGPKSSYHLVLTALDRIDDDRYVSAREIADAIGVEMNAVSTVLSKLYSRKLADRKDGQRPYTYKISSYGRAELDEHGTDVTPDDVGGVWNRD